MNWKQEPDQYYLVRIHSQRFQWPFWFDQSMHAWNATPFFHIVADEISLNELCVYNLEVTIECKEACRPGSGTIFGWDVNIKSMQDFEFLGVCVDSSIICESPNWELRKSGCEPSKLVTSYEHQSVDLIRWSIEMNEAKSFSQK